MIVLNSLVLSTNKLLRPPFVPIVPLKIVSFGWCDSLKLTECPHFTTYKPALVYLQSIPLPIYDPLFALDHFNIHSVILNISPLRLILDSFCRTLDKDEVVLKRDGMRPRNEDLTTRLSISSTIANSLTLSRLPFLFLIFNISTELRSAKCFFL